MNNNELKTIPAALWRLKNLKHLYLRDNPWEDEWVEIINANSDPSGKFVNIPSFLEILRKSCSVTLFLSYAVTDYESYPLAKVADNLKSREEIYYVYHCMQDMEKAGNIDDFMREFIALSHILLFFATERSLRSEDCRHELESAKSLGLKIIPILGAGVTWRDLERLGIEREYGLNIRDYKLYQDLCDKLYAYILQYKQAHASELFKTI